MTIRRGPAPKSEYAQIKNSALRDDRLSWKARGLLVYLLSHREGWETSVDNLARQAPDGKASVRTGLHELIELGYVTRSEDRNRDARGLLTDYDYVVTDDPASDFPTLDEPTYENRTHYKKTSSPEDQEPEDDSQQRPAGRSTARQLVMISDLYRASGRWITEDVVAEWDAMSIAEADTLIKRLTRERRRNA